MSKDVELILQQLADENRPVRSINLTGFSDLPQAQATEVFAALADLSARRRLELVSTMAEQAEANVHLHFHPLLRECLADAEPTVRKVAIDGLWEDERPNLVAPMARLLAEDASPEVRSAAAISLGRFILLGVLGEIGDSYTGRAAQAMHAAWSRPGEVVEVRRRVLEGLAYIDEAGVDELIETAYYDEDDLLRQSAVFAMGRTADRHWSKIILTELGSGDGAMRYEAAGAAGELALTAAVKPLIRLLDDPDSAVRETAALALGKIGGRDARQALRACLESSDRGLAEAAAGALEELTFNSENQGSSLMDYGRRSGSDPLAEDEAIDDEDDFDDMDFDNEDDDEDDDDKDDKFGDEEDHLYDEDEDDELDEDFVRETGWRRGR